MDKLTEKALKVASIFAVIFFLIPFIVNWMEANFIEGLTNGIVGGLIFGGIAFLISKSTIKNKVTFKWWQWIFYVLGWMFGFANLLFWLIMYGIHMSKNYGDPFFNKDFHRRVYIWGIVITIIVIASVSLIFFIE
ncbi:hypothetical protein HOK51_05175 [Candidatus Woesearchaeota archaeon]|jgi:hypothetical protein|nr:hypothetical protein [Candidatus Woesearchaeota archaeon]MBT6519219.1 hypothetical protein [Candidatus Woesearchaeota archaeon]MBT7368941.1 hypothetical protein [Candidatus Woesearchaeota archaeon]